MNVQSDVINVDLQLLWTSAPVSSSGSQLDVQSSDSKLFAALGDILSRQHGSIWRRLISVCLHLHATSHTADRFPGNKCNVTQRANITSQSRVLGPFTYLPDRSVTWTKVSLKEAKMWHTPNTFSPSATWGPRLITCSSFFSFPLRGAIVWRKTKCQTPHVSTSIKTVLSPPEMTTRAWISCKTNAKPASPHGARFEAHSSFTYQELQKHHQMICHWRWDTKHTISTITVVFQRSHGKHATASTKWVNTTVVNGSLPIASVSLLASVDNQIL